MPFYKYCSYCTSIITFDFYCKKCDCHFYFTHWRKDIPYTFKDGRKHMFYAVISTDNSEMSIAKYGIEFDLIYKSKDEKLISTLNPDSIDSFVQRILDLKAFY